MPATFSVPERRPNSWPPPPVIERPSGVPAAHVEHADALGAAELVRRKRKQVDAERAARRAAASLPPGPRRCEKARRARVATARQRGDRLDRSDLVVRIHDRCQNRPGRQRRAKRAGSTRPSRIDRNQRDVKAFVLPARRARASTAWCSIADRDALAPAVPIGPRGAQQRQVVRFRAAAGEDDLVARRRRDSARNRGRARRRATARARRPSACSELGLITGFGNVRRASRPRPRRAAASSPRNRDKFASEFTGRSQMTSYYRVCEAPTHTPRSSNGKLAVRVVTRAAFFFSNAAPASARRAGSAATCR